MAPDSKVTRPCVALSKSSAASTISGAGLRRGKCPHDYKASRIAKMGAIDLAIVGVMADGGLRRSEAAALTWNDVEFWPGETARALPSSPSRRL